MLKRMTRITVWVSFLITTLLAITFPAPAVGAEKPADQEAPTLPSDYVSTLKWRSIGPANMGGRIVDLEVHPSDSNLWWAATASGGILKTENNGITFTHQFDHENTVSVGDMAVAPSDPKIVWVGTGEANPRNSVSWGDGVYKSTDGGDTWKQMGLTRTFQIGRIAIHPENPDIVYVGALGRLWGDSEERGLFKTVDGGETWDKLLFIDEKTGVVDVRMKPGEPETLLVATWERQRDGFDSNAPKKKWGPGSGIYKTTDGGKTFKKMTEGLPAGPLGRIGLDFYAKDPNVVFAIVESEKIGQEPENAPYIGIRGEDVDVGARLTEITEDGPAEKAGLKVGDIVIAIEDTRVHSYSDLLKTIRQYMADDTVKIEVSRDRKSKSLEVTFSRRPGSEEDKEVKPETKEEKSGSEGKKPELDAEKIGLESEKIGLEAEKIGLEADKFGLEAEGIGLESEKIGLEAEGIGLESEKIGLEAEKKVEEKSKVSSEPKAEETAEEKTETTTEAEAESKAEGKEKKSTEKKSEPSGRQRRSVFSSGLGGQRENLQDQQGREGKDYGGLYKSTDCGETWTRINSVNPRPMYFSQIRVDPSDDQYLYVLGISLYRSKDGGETFTSDGGRGVHPDHHALWIDPADGRHMILGTDGGLYITFDRMEKWDLYNHVAIGQFYHVAMDPRPNYRVYGGLQDNGTWGGPNRSRSGGGPINEDWISIGGGDGFICRVDRDDPDQVYYASQNGGLGRVNLRTGDQGYLRPRAPRGVRYRFNWMTPFLLSHHNPGIYYCAGNFVFRSLYHGEKLKPISPEITNTDEGSATVLAECPFDPDLLYVGTDDGALWRTKNNGHDWENLFEVEAKKGEDKGTAPAEAASQGDPGERGRRGEAGSGRRSGRRGSPGMMVDRLMEQDANKDGKIQKDEAPEMMLRFFERFDTNGDEVIDEGELNAMKKRGEGDRPKEGPPAKEARSQDRSSREKPSPAEEGKYAPAWEEKPTTAQDEKVTPAEVEKVSTPPEEKPSSAQDEKASPAQEEQASPAQDEKPSAPPAEDPITGEWTVKTLIPDMPEEGSESAMFLKLAPGGKVTGSTRSPRGEGTVEDGKFSAESGKLTFSLDMGQMALDVEAKLTGARMAGTMEMGGGDFSFEFEAKRVSATLPAGEGAEESEEEADGHEWQTIGKLLPGPRWVSSMEPSRFKEGRVYLTLDGHRSNDDAPYVFVSKNHGQTWRSLTKNLPARAGTTRVIREDLKNPDMLYLGTEFGAYVTVDRGRTWTRLNSNLPTVAIHEIAQHPGTGEIAAATHGRSIWILDVTPLRQMTEESLSEKVHLFKPNTAHYWRSEPRRGSTTRRYVGENPEAGAGIYYSLARKAKKISLKILNVTGDTVRELETNPEPGFHCVNWDLRLPVPDDGSRRGYRRRGPRVEPGTYLVVLTVDNQTLSEPLEIRGDPEFPDARLWGEEFEEK